MRCLFSKKGAFSRGNDFPGFARSFGFAKLVEEARPQHQSGKPREHAQVSPLVTAANEEVYVGQPAVRSAERYAVRRPAISHDVFTECSRDMSAGMRYGDSRAKSSAGQFLTLLDSRQDACRIVDLPSLLGEIHQLLEDGSPCGGP